MGLINLMTESFFNKHYSEEIRLRDLEYQQTMERRALEKRLDELIEPNSFQELKDHLKALANEIKFERQQMYAAYPEHHRVAKEKINEKMPYYWLSAYFKPYVHMHRKNSKAKEYRLRHITYCLLKGKTMEQIEPKVGRPLLQFELDIIEKIKTRCKR